MALSSRGHKDQSKEYAFLLTHKDPCQSENTLAGVFVLSSYACDDSHLWHALQATPQQRRPPLYQRHGAADDYILPAWGRATADRLRGEGVDVDFALEPRLEHRMSEGELAALTAWVLQRLHYAPDREL